MKRSRNELTMNATARVAVSNAAGELYERMGNGSRLRMPIDGSQGATIPMRPNPEGGWLFDLAEGTPVSREAFEQLKATGFIHKLTEHGEPPPAQRKPREGWRNGWRESGLDGDVADWWVCTQ